MNSPPFARLASLRKIVLLSSELENIKLVILAKSFCSDHKDERSQYVETYLHDRLSVV